MKKQLLFIILLLSGHFLFGQTTVNLNPSQDNSIYSEAVNNSNGVGQLFAARTSTGNLRRGLLQFDLSSIPSSATITSVTLELNVNRVRGVAANHTLHRATTAWGEGTSLASGQQGSGTIAAASDATWNNAVTGGTAWTTPGGDFIAAPSATHLFPATTGSVTIPTSAGLIADVQNWINGTNTNNGWVLIGDETTNTRARRFGSKDQGTAPILSITYQSLVTVNLIPSRDNSVFQNNTNNSNGAGVNLFSGYTCFSSSRRAFMGFDLSSIPAGAVITSVELTLNINRIGSGATIDNYTLHRVTTDWGEGTSNNVLGQGAAAAAPDATWNAAMFGTVTWTTSGGDFIASPSATQNFPSTTGSTTIASSAGLVADVQNWIDSINSNFGWVLLGNEGVICSARRFGSRENVGNEPMLTIIYDDSLLSTPDNTLNNNTFTVYPNPSNDGIFNINSAQNVTIDTIEVFNLLGQRVTTLDTIADNTASINLSTLKSGMYFLMIHDVDGNLSKKRIIKN